MNDLKQQTGKVIKMSDTGPGALLAQAEPQAMQLSPAHWHALLDKLEDMQDAIVTLKAELEIATGQSQVEAINDVDAFIKDVQKSSPGISMPV